MKSPHPDHVLPPKTNEGKAPRDKVMNPESDEMGSVSPEKPQPVEALSAEEQMARYEDALKEDDWGHQPC